MIVESLRHSYPHLYRFVKNSLSSRATGNARVWTAFLRYSELNDAAGRQCLRNGTLPELVVAVMPGSNGRFRGRTSPNRIEFAQTAAQAFERHPTNANWQLLAESTILHELVHWGDWKDGRDQPGEEGKAFERAAYGHDVNRPTCATCG